MLSKEQITGILGQLSLHTDFPYRKQAAFILNEDAVCFTALYAPEGANTIVLTATAHVPLETEEDVLRAAYQAVEQIVRHEIAECFLVDGLKRFDPHRFPRVVLRDPITLTQDELDTMPVYGRGSLVPNDIVEGYRWLCRGKSGRGWEVCEAQDNRLFVYPVSSVCQGSLSVSSQ